MIIKKLKYILLHQFYHPYFGYWLDLFSERHLKNRVGDCVDCIECCRHIGGEYCKHINIKTKRCLIYKNRTCDEWFPVSQKEIDFMVRIKPDFKCRFSFKKNKL
jgi:hypothetical protein